MSVVFRLNERPINANKENTKTKKTSNDAKSRFICRKRGAGMFLKSAESGNPSRLKSNFKSNWVRGSPLGVWRPPDEAARDLRLHGDLRRRLSPVRSAALQAVSQSHDRLLTPQPSPSVLHSFLRRRLVGRLESQHAVLALPVPRRLDGSFDIVRNRSQSCCSRVSWLRKGSLRVPTSKRVLMVGFTFASRSY